MKKTRYILAVILCSLFVLPATAQWTEVTGFDHVISDMQVFENKLHVVGGFTKRENETSIWHTVYNGSTFEDNTQAFSIGALSNMAVFNNKLYAVGATGYYTWDGSVFQNDEENSHGAIYSDGSLLYLGSDFGQVRHMNANGEMTTYPELQGFSGDVQAIIKYKGQLIIAGRFETSGSTELNGLARWDGSAWQPLGSGKGVTGGVSGSNVMGMIIYKDELYIYGSFTEIDGKEIASIAKWNGTEWSDVGGSNPNTSLSNGVRDAAVYNNELYICGDFSQMGTTQAKFVARWDGKTWRAINLTETNNFPNSIAIYKDELYVGTFDFDESNIYKRAIPLSVEPVNAQAVNISIYPNPAANQLVIEAGENIYTAIILTDVAGRQYTIKSAPMAKQTIDISHLPAGLYFIRINQQTYKFTRQ